MTDNEVTTDIAYSTDEETFHSDICSAIYDSLPGDTLFYGESVTPCPSAFVPDAGWIIEYMYERAYDNHGEWVEDNLTVSKEAEQELEAFLKDWAVRNVKVSFYSVEKIQSRALTEEDF